MCWVHHVTGVWVYPLLEYIGPLARGLFFSCLMLLLCLYYILGDILNTYIWDPSSRGVCVCVWCVWSQGITNDQDWNI